MQIYLEFEYRRGNCSECGVRQEAIPWLSSSHRSTKRFAQAIGRQCREMSVTRVAEMNQLSWHQVHRLETEYMEYLLKKHPPSKKLRAIGVDEVSIRKGHSYAIVVADLDQGRPIWMGSTGRAEEDMDAFFDEMGQKRSNRIQIAVMDMWKPF